jgi:hypothetical protein
LDNEREFQGNAVVVTNIAKKKWETFFELSVSYKADLNGFKVSHFFGIGSVE